LYIIGPSPLPYFLRLHMVQKSMRANTTSYIPITSYRAIWFLSTVRRLTVTNARTFHGK